MYQKKERCIKILTHSWVNGTLRIWLILLGNSKYSITRNKSIKKTSYHKQHGQNIVSEICIGDLIWFKLCFLGRILAINWEIQILSFTKIFFNLGICCEIKIYPGFYCLICIFWYYSANSKIYWNILITFCIWRAISGCFSRTSK